MDLSKFTLLQWYILIFITGIILIASDFSRKKVCILNNELFSEKAFLITGVVLGLSVLASMRTGIGDTSNYINIFHRMPVEWEDFVSIVSQYQEKGFYFLNYLIKQIFGDNQYIYLFIMSFTTLGGIAYFLYNNSTNAGTCFLIYILSGAFVSGMNGLRQAFVASIFLAFYKLINNRKYILCIIICVILSSVHTSALILIPVIFILNLKAWGKGTYYLLLVTAGLYIAYPLFAGFLGLVLAGSSYEVYSNGIQNFTNGGANVIRAIISFLPIFFSFLFRKQLERKNSNFNILLNGAILNFMFMLLATVRSWIFARFCVYFNPFSYALLIEAIEVSKNKRILYILCILLYGLFFYYEMKSSVYII